MSAQLLKTPRRCFDHSDCSELRKCSLGTQKEGANFSQQLYACSNIFQRTLALPECAVQADKENGLGIISIHYF